MKRALVMVLALLVPAMAWGQTEVRGALSSNTATTLDVTGMGAAAIVVSGTYSGTVNFEVIGAPGAAARAAVCAPPDAQGTTVSSTTSTGTWVCQVAGVKYLQARMSGYVSGTANVALTGSRASAPRLGMVNTEDTAAGSTLNSILSSMSQDATHANASISTGPQLMGHGATAAPTAVTAGQAVRAWYTLSGQAVTAPTAHTAGGCTPAKLISAATTNATSVKASAGQLYALQVINLNAATRYLKLYNKATAPTVGTDVPVQTLPIPPNSTTGGGFVLPVPVGMEFTTGIAFALTTGVADADVGAVAANEIIVNYCTK